MSEELKTYDFPVDNGDFTTTIELFYLKSEADKVIRQQKYKRCLAMARWCVQIMIFNSKYGTDKKWHIFKKWHKRWLELAEKFKEAK